MQSRHFACPFQAADDGMQMGVHITLYPFYTTKKMLRQQCQKYFFGSKVSFHIV